MKRKKPTPKRDKLRKPGEHWYEVTDLFDPNKIRSLGDHLFIMGKLDGVVIVEVPDGTGPQAVDDLRRRLQAAGITSIAFAVESGIRFLKLKALNEIEEERIESALSKRKTEDGPGTNTDNPGA
jgi:hypothetical protein